MNRTLVIAVALFSVSLAGALYAEGRPFGGPSVVAPAAPFVGAPFGDALDDARVELEGVPRPAGIPRVASGGHDGYELRGYEVGSSFGLAAYDAALVASGWSRDDAVASAIPTTRFYEKEGRTLAVFLDATTDLDAAADTHPLWLTILPRR